MSDDLLICRTTGPVAVVNCFGGAEYLQMPEMKSRQTYDSAWSPDDPVYARCNNTTARHLNNCHAGITHQILGTFTAQG